MKVKILNENLEGHYYYHFTTPSGVLSIFDSNQFTATEEKSKFLKGKKTVSFTRYSEPYFITNPAFVRIMIDMNKLSNDYKTTSFDFFNYNARARGQSEAEVAIIGDIKNAKKYIVRVDVCKDVFKDDKSVVLYPYTGIGGMRATVTPREYFEAVLQSRAVVGIMNTRKIIFRTKDFNCKSFNDFKNKIPVTCGGLFDFKDKSCYKKAKNSNDLTIDTTIPDYPVFLAEIISTPFRDEILEYYLIVAQSRDKAENIMNNYFSDKDKVDTFDIISFKDISIFDIGLNFKGIVENDRIKSFYDLVRLNINEEDSSARVFIQDYMENDWKPYFSLVNINQDTIKIG